MPLGGRELKRAWVTSATSFLGRHVAAHLAEQGYSVVGLARREVPPESARQWGFAHVEIGQFDAVLLERTAQHHGAPAVIFHAIGSGSVGQALSDPAADTERTVGTARTLIDFLARFMPSVRLIYPSSAAVYGVTAPGPIAEDAPPQPASVYGKNKLLVEKMSRDRVASDGLDIVLLRIFSLFGEPQRKLLLWDLGRRLVAGERTVTLGGTGEETRDFLYVRDAAAAIGVLAAMSNPPRLLNVGTGQATSIRQLTSMFKAALRVTADVNFSGNPRPGDPPHQQADVTQLLAAGISRPTALNDGLAAYARWLQSAEHKVVT